MNSSSNIVHLRQNYQVKVTLKGAKPPIWRRLVVDSRITLESLHDALQISMGWQDHHLHQFVDRNGKVYSPADDDFMSDFGLGEETVDESQVLLNELLKKEKDWLQYEYDFGDGWNHKIILEKLLPHEKSQVSVVCIKGRRSCPPEDCGGIFSYKNILEELELPAKKRDKELMEWVGEGFDAAHFNPDEVNGVLHEVFDGVVFNGKAGLENELQRIKKNTPLLEDMFTEVVDELGLLQFSKELLDNPNTPEDMKGMFNDIQEAAGIVVQMDMMIDLAMRALEDILEVTKDKKVIAIAEEALAVLDAEPDNE